MSIEREQNHTLRNVVIAGGLLTAALHGYIEGATDHGHGPRFEAATLNPWAPTDTQVTDLGTQRVGDPYLDTVSDEDTEIGTPIQEDREEIKLTGAAYARLFDADPMADELEEQSIDSFVSLIREYEADGWTVSVNVQGLASAEDATNDGVGGVQTPSEDNGRLADYRRDVFVDTLVAAGVDESTITLEKGDEGELTESQLDALQSLSNQFGYQSTEALIEAYNDNPDAVPPAVATTLDSWLDEHRGVTAVMVASRARPGEDIALSTEREVCVVPVVDVTRKDITTGSWKVTIPYGVLLPVVGLPLASAALTIVGARAFMRDMRAYRARGAGGGGADGANSGPTAPPDPVEPDTPAASQTPPETPQDKPEKKRKWPWLLPPIIIVGAGLLLQTCDDSAPKRRPEVVSEDPCRGLEPVERVVGTRTIEVRDGRPLNVVDDLHG